MATALGVGSAGVALAAGTYAYGLLHSQSQMFGPTLRATASAKQFALTFDDGPNPAATPRLLDLLDRHKVRATFFLIGNYVRAHAELARETAARGHQVGNHTQNHPNLFWVGRGRVRRELENCQTVITDVVGEAPRWMRPPFGARSPFLDGIIRQMNFRGVAMWTQIPGDWDPQPPERLIARMRPIAENIARRGEGKKKGGDILVLHDGDHRVANADRDHTLKALEYWLPRWRDAGLEFVTIENAASKKLQ